MSEYTRRSTFLDEELLPYPFCPGCGHGVILDCLDQALGSLQLDPKQVVIVTDIGCVGLSDRYYKTNALHGLHGRSLTYATGIKLVRPELEVIVLVGDGGCGIGGAHLINAARRNIGITTLVFNNLNYGMTGGEHSATTPLGGITATTPLGNLEQPMDVCGTVAVNGATFVARTTSFDKNLSDLIAQAISNNGFSLIDIWELCVAYYVPNNRFNRKLLQDSMQEMGFDSGVLRKQQRQEYSSAYRHATAELQGQDAFTQQPLEVQYKHSLGHPMSFVIAGAAGMRIGSSASAFCRGAVMSGLWVKQQNDYPVTVRSGFSLAEITLNPGEGWFNQSEARRNLVILFSEGLDQVRAQLPELSKRDTVYINNHLLPIETPARIVPLDFSAVRRKASWSAVAMAEILHTCGIYPLEAYHQAIAMKPDYVDGVLPALEAGFGKVISVGD